MADQINNELVSGGEYSLFRDDILKRIRSAQYEALRAVNKELISLYWEIGRQITERQKTLGWGKSVVENLSRDIQEAFPGIQGFGVSNLRDMARFYAEYQHDEILQPLVGEISWTKHILSEEELQKLFATHYPGENPEIRRAFAMTCLSGIRHCDIVTLTYSEVDYSNKILKFRQNKTKKHSSSSGVTIPLNDTLLNIIGVKAPDAKDDYIFHLPSDTMCLKALRHWTKKAGIDKHITWHCGRHSFGTQLLNNGANIKVVSSLLGHSSLRFTEIYVRAVDEEKKKAINSMPSIDIL